MLREFSKELAEDREFEIGGQVFKFRYPYWEEMAAIFDGDLTPSGNGDGGFSFKADTQLAIDLVPIFLDDDGPERWKELVARKPNGVPRHQIVQVYRWLVEVTGFPTSPLSPSAPGVGSGDISSPAASSSPEATPPA